MDNIEEMHGQRERLEAAGVHFKYSEASAHGWIIEAVFNDAEGIGDLTALTSVAEVDAFIGSFCPNCWRIDRRRRRGGLCSPCEFAIASARTTD